MYFPFGENLTKDTGGLSSSERYKMRCNRRQLRVFDTLTPNKILLDNTNSDNKWKKINKKKNVTAHMTTKLTLMTNYICLSFCSQQHYYRRERLYEYLTYLPINVFKHCPDAVSHIRLQCTEWIFNVWFCKDSLIRPIWLKTIEECSTFQNVISSYL